MKNLNVLSVPKNWVSNRTSAILGGLLAVALTAGVGYAALASLHGNGLNLPALFNKQESSKEHKFTEGPVTEFVVEAGPFDIKRKYRSMEGPFCGGSFKIADLVETKKIALPESAVGFVELGGLAPSMNGGGTNDVKDVPGLLHSDDNNTLYWIKGLKLEVIDEKGQVMPDAEFICHFNWNNDPTYHNKRFPESYHTLNSRLFSITQGQTEMYLPNGFGIPAASDEFWNFWFQAANRTTSEHRRLKHRCTFYLIKDHDLQNPIQPLHGMLPTMGLVTDRNFPDLTTEYKKVCPACAGTSSAVNAPNDVIGGVYSDRKGRRYTGHWVVPPGQHTYTCMVNDLETPGFGNPKDDIAPVIHMVWSHVHPLCTDFSLYEVTDSGRRLVFSSKGETKTTPGLQITHLDLFSSEEGIPLHPVGAKYELEQTYNNTLNEPIDSMGTFGVYFTDKKFIRPEWSLPDHKVVSCLARPGTGDACDLQPVANKKALELAQSIIAKPIALATAKDLGPILKAPVKFELMTLDGPLHIQLEPALAPKTATYMANLISHGGLNSTKLYDYQPNFILAVSRPDDKGTRSLDERVRAHLLMRRIPLEINNKMKHHLYCLSMSHDSDKDSGLGSFCIMLGDAPQMDGKYSIFGHLIPDKQTLGALASIKENWDRQKSTIVAAKRI